jgi:hypothetical protein
VNAFSAAIDTIFADPNMAADAFWTPRGGWVATPCRLILTRPDDVTDFGGARLVSSTILADVRVTEIASPNAGDRIEIGTERYTIQGKPRRDRERLVWQLELVPA